MKRSIPALVAACTCLILATTGCADSYTVPSETALRGEQQGQYYWDKASITLQDLAQASDVVVCADVTRVLEGREKPVSSVSSVSDTERQFVEIKVREVLRGEAQTGQRLYVGDSGMMIMSDKNQPQVRDCEFTEFGEPLMQKGNRVVLFLNTMPTLSNDRGAPFYALTNGYDGKFFAGRDQLYHLSLTLATIEHTAPAYTLADPSPKTLEQIRAAVA